MIPTAWVNLYEDGKVGMDHPTREEADDHAFTLKNVPSYNRVARIRVYLKGRKA